MNHVLTLHLRYLKRTNVFPILSASTLHGIFRRPTSSDPFAAPARTWAKVQPNSPTALVASVKTLSPMLEPLASTFPPLAATNRALQRQQQVERPTR
jgi:hypothetical protein